MKKSPSVAIIIVNWNGLKCTDACLESLKKLNYHHYKVVLVDNNSDDDSVDYFKSEFSEAQLIALLQNKGFTGGNNAGIKWALENDFSYVLLLNNDTIINDSNFLSAMISELETDKTAGMACPSILYHDDPNKVWYAGGKCSLWSGWKHCYDKPTESTPKTNGYATGCCLLAKSTMINDIGFLNSAYFLSVEDVEWSQRAKRAGWSILFIPKASILHKVSMSSRSRKKGMFSPTRIYYEWRNSIFFIREYANSLQKILIWPARFGGHSLYKAVAYILLGRRQKLKAMAKGIKDGLLTDKLQFKNKYE